MPPLLVSVRLPVHQLLLQWRSQQLYFADVRVLLQQPRQHLPVVQQQQLRRAVLLGSAGGLLPNHAPKQLARPCKRKQGPGKRARKSMRGLICIS